MKFSELTREQWVEWRPFLDTCLIPVTGLSGMESPVEAADRLEELRDWLELVEIPFHGRVVTYPAYHYCDIADDSVEAWKPLNALIRMLRRNGFRYVFVMSRQLHISVEQVHEADIVLTPFHAKLSEYENASNFVELRVQEIWSSSQSDL